MSAGLHFPSRPPVFFQIHVVASRIQSLAVIGLKFPCLLASCCPCCLLFAARLLKSMSTFTASTTFPPILFWNLFNQVFCPTVAWEQLLPRSLWPPYCQIWGSILSFHLILLNSIIKHSWSPSSSLHCLFLESSTPTLLSSPSFSISFAGFFPVPWPLVVMVLQSSTCMHSLGEPIYSHALKACCMLMTPNDLQPVPFC